MTCTRCGATPGPGAAYCPNCGAPVAAPVPAAGAGAGAAPVYAGFWRRCAAMILDSIVLQIATLPLVLVVFGSGGPGFEVLRDDDLPSAEVMALLGQLLQRQALLGLVHWLYFALLESSPRQATLGKMALGLRVADVAGRRLSFLRATGRFAAKMLSGLTLLIGYLVMLFTERRQTLHDLVAGTVVVRGEPR